MTQAPPLVLVLRGASGSGKSTWAARYKARWGETVRILSATDFFRDDTGQVRFNQEWLAESHRWCQNALYWLCQLREPRIVVDNTHTQRWEYEVAAAIALDLGYQVFQHVCTGTWPNTNGVPERLVQTQRARFEDDPRIQHYQPALDGL